MSLIDFTAPILDLYGEKMKAPTPDGKDVKDMTLGFLAATALGKAAQGEDIEPEEKFKCFLLGLKVVESEMSNQPLDLEAKDIVRLKKRIGKMFVDPAIVGRAFELIEPRKET